jgi:peroxiredoxin
MMSVLACGAVALATGLAGASWQPSASTSEKAKVGEKAPDFTLTDLEGKEYTLSELTKDGKIVVLEWFNPDCPWVKKHHTQLSMLEDTQKEFKDEVVWLAINSGAKGKQGTGVERNLRAKKDFEMAYPILLDESGTVGRAYGAKTTPHMYVIDKEGVLRYMGAADSYLDVREHAKRNYTRDAIVGILADETIEVTETKPYGCGVKYARN